MVTALADAPPVPGLRRPFYRGVGPNTYQSVGTVTTFTVPQQPGTVEGDWIFIYLFGTGNGSGVACPGFKVVQEGSVAASALLWKQAGRNEPSSYTITGLNSKAVAVATLTVVAPGGLDPVVIGSFNTILGSPSLTVTGLTLANDNDLVLAFVGNEQGYNVASIAFQPPNSDWSVQATNGAQSANPCVMCAANPYFGPGATGTATFTVNGGATNTNWGGILVGFAPASGMARQDMRTEFNLGSLGWTDVTEDVQLQGDVEIGRGKPDEQTTMTPSTLTMTVNNEDGRYFDGNPTGPYFGNLGRNTPVRVSMPEGASYVRFRDDTTSFVSGPTGGITPNDLDFQFDMTLDNWRAAQQIAGKWNGTSDSWALLLNDFGSLTLNISTTGTDTKQLFSQVPLPIPPGRRGCIRFTYHSASSKADLYFSPGGGLLNAQWEHIDTITFGGSNPMFAGTATTVLGNINNSVFSGTPSITGKLHAARMLANTLQLPLHSSGGASSKLATVNGGAMTWAVNPVAGQKVLVWLFVPSSETISSVVDNGTTPRTFVLDASETANGLSVQLWRADNITLPSAGSYAVTVTGTGGSTIIGQGMAYNGIAAGGPTQVTTSTGAAGTSSTASTAGVTSTNTWGTALTGLFTGSALLPEPFGLASPYFDLQFLDNTTGVARRAAWADSLAYGCQAIPGPVWSIPDQPSYVMLTAVYEPLTPPTVTWSPDFTVQPPGTFCFPDAQNIGWCTNQNAVICDRRYLFWGELSAFPTSWNNRGTKVAIAMQAGGPLRRLSQSASQQPLTSCLRRAWGGTAGSSSKLNNLLAYWPCEDGNSQGFSFATSNPPPFIAAGIKGVPNGTYAGQPNFAANSNFQASLSLPSFNNSTWNFSIPRNGPNDTTQYMRFLMQYPQGNESAVGTGSVNAPVVVLELHTTGTARRIQFYVIWSSGALTPSFGLRGYNSAGTQIFDSGGVGPDPRGWAYWISVEMQQSGTNVQWAVLWELVGNYPSKWVGLSLGTFAGTLGNGNSIIGDPGANLLDTTVGHITYQNGAANQQDMSGGEFAQVINAMIGETAGARFQRLCTEQAIPVVMRGQVADTQPMGPQTATDLISLLQECVDCDRGMFWEPPWLGALGYRCLNSLLNQTPVQVAYEGTIVSAGDLQSSEDDQFTINDAIVVNTYTGGQAEVAVTSGPLSNQAPPNGVGPYQQQPQINMAFDWQASDEAGWITWVGTAPDQRYPKIPFHMQRAAPSPATFNALAELDVGDRLQITTPASAPANTAQPVWLPPSSQTLVPSGGIDVLVNEQSTTLNVDTYDQGIVGVPASPYMVAVADDPVMGRVDSSTTTVDAPAGPTDTLLAIANPIATPQQLWTLNGNDYPFDLDVGGEQITALLAHGTPATRQSSSANPPQIAIPPSGDHSLIYGAVVDLSTSSTFTPDANTTFSANVADATNARGYGTFRTTAVPPIGPGSVTIGASAPAVACAICVAEIMGCGNGTITEDASSPASVNSLTAKTVSTAAFSPPPGSLIVAMIACNGTGGFVTLTVSGGPSGGSWRLLTNDGSRSQTAIFAMRVPAGFSGTTVVTATASGAASANGILLTVKVLDNGAAGAGTEVMIVARSQNGVVKSQAVGTPVALNQTPAASL